MISKKVLLATVCIAVLMVAVGAYGYVLYSEVSSLKDQISSVNQELETLYSEVSALEGQITLITQGLEELWEEINALKTENSTYCNGQLSLKTDKDIYILEENVTITLTNIGNETVMLAGYPAWEIFTCPEGDRAYPHTFAWLLWSLDSGENDTITWNQYNDETGSLVEPGMYVVRDTQGMGLYACFEILPPDNSGPNFTFTWGPNTQEFVDGTFRMEIWFTLDGENLSMTVKLNDLNYNEWNYLGLVFDTNQNGYIDIHDESYGLHANNMTRASVLCEHGLIGWTFMSPWLGPQKVSFNSNEGYTYAIQFPCSFRDGIEWNPVQVLKKGDYNPLHICYGSDNRRGVYVQFRFYIPEEV